MSDEKGCRLMDYVPLEVREIQARTILFEYKKRHPEVDWSMPRRYCSYSQEEVAALLAARALGCRIEVIAQEEGRSRAAVQTRLKTSSEPAALFRRDWTVEEEEILRREYAMLGSALYKKLPGRSPRAIRSHAAEMKLKFSNHHTWTTEELRFVHDTIEKVASVLGVSQPAVVGQAVHMFPRARGVSKPSGKKTVSK